MCNYIQFCEKETLHPLCTPKKIHLLMEIMSGANCIVKCSPGGQEQPRPWFVVMQAVDSLNYFVHFGGKCKLFLRCRV